MSQHPAIDLDELLSHSGWMRSLARRLVHDDDEADDVVQEVLITALQKPPRQLQALPSWLSKVTRTRAFRMNRTRSRRSRREEKADPREGTISPPEMAERFELQAILADAVQSLEEPYRTTVYLRFYAELTPPEIASRMATTASTVRTRLSRGLRQLREKLDQRDECNGTSWRAALLPLAFPEIAVNPVAQPGGSEQTMTSVGSHGVFVWSAVATVLLALLVSVPLIYRSTIGDRASSSNSETASRATGVSDAVRSTGPSPLEGAGLPSSSASSNRSTAQSLPLGSPNSVAERVVPPAQERASSVVVVDATSNAPVGNAAIYLGRQVEGFSELVGHTDSTGSLPVPSELLARAALLVFSADHVEMREAPRSRAIDRPYEIRLRPCFPAKVEVVDQDGRSVLGASVEVTTRTPLPDLPPPEQGRTDSAGHFEYRYQFAGTEVRVTAEGLATVAVAAETPTTRVTMAPGRPIDGEVTDERGQPLANCRIEIRTVSHRRIPSVVRSDPNGRFSLGRLASAELVTLSFFHPDLPAHRITALPPESKTWTVAIPDSTWIEGRLVDEAGQPVSSGFAFLARPTETSSRNNDPGSLTEATKLRTPAAPKPRAASPQRRARFQLKPFARTNVQPDGSFRVGPLSRGSTNAYLLVVHPTLVNRVQAIRLETADGFVPEKLSLGEIEISSGRVITGRVTSPSGDPLAGITLFAGEFWSNDMESMVGRARTDEDGRFALRGVPLLDRGSQRDGNSGSLVHQRELVFVTPFAPDVLLLANGEAVRSRLAAGEPPQTHGDTAHSIPGTATIPAGEAQLELVVGRALDDADLTIELLDENDDPVRTFTPVSLVALDGSATQVVLGPDPQGPRVYADGTLPLQQTCDALFRPSGFRWHAARLVPSSSDALVVQLESLPVRPSLARLADPDGRPLEFVELFVGFPFGSTEPHHFVPLGKTDSKGSLELGFLPAGSYRFYGYPASPTATTSSGEPSSTRPRPPLIGDAFLPDSGQISLTVR